MIPLFLFQGRPGTLSIQTSRQAARNRSYRCRRHQGNKNRSQSARLRFSYAVPIREGRLNHLCQNISYGKEQHPQGNHLHQRQGGGGLRQADSFREEQARQRAEPHGHRGSIPKSV